MSDSKVARFYGQADHKPSLTTALSPPPYKKPKGPRKLVLKSPVSPSVAVFPEDDDEKSRPLTPMVFGPSDAPEDLDLLQRKAQYYAANCMSPEPLQAATESSEVAFPTPPSAAGDNDNLIISRHIAGRSRSPSPIPLSLRIPGNTSEMGSPSSSVSADIQTLPQTSNSVHPWSSDLSSELLSPSSVSVDAPISFSRPSPVDSVDSLPGTGQASPEGAASNPHPGVARAASLKSTVSSSPSSTRRPQRQAPSSMFTSPMVFASLSPYITVTPSPPPPFPSFFPRRRKSQRAQAPSPVSPASPSAAGPSRTRTTQAPVKRMTPRGLFGRRVLSVPDLQEAPPGAGEGAASTSAMSTAVSVVTSIASDSTQLSRNTDGAGGPSAEPQKKGARVQQVLESVADHTGSGVEVSVMADRGWKETAVGEAIPSLRMLKAPTRVKLW